MFSVSGKCLRFHLPAVLISAALFLIVDLAASLCQAQSPIIDQKLPKITETTVEEKRLALEPNEVSPIEIQLFERFQRIDAPDEVFAFSEGTVLERCSQLTEIIVRGNNAELRFYPDDCKLRYFYRSLSGKEMQALRKFILEKSVDQLPAYATGGWDGVGYNYWHFTKDGGYRVVMINPLDFESDAEEIAKLKHDDPKLVYSRLIKLFNGLGQYDKLKIKYLNERLLSGMEVLYAHPENEIYAVWAKGDDIRVLVGKQFECPEQWRSFRDGKIGKDVDTPDIYKERHSDKDCVEIMESFDLQDANNIHYLVTPDERYLVGKAKNKLFCIDLVKEKMVPIKSDEAATQFDLLEYIPIHKKFLLIDPKKTDLRLSKPKPFYFYSNSPSAEFCLLDPSTGKTEELKSHDPLPFRQKMNRPFQPAAEEGVVWTAIAYPGENPFSQIGRFDTKDFRFRNLTGIDTLDIESNDVWVDEAAGKIYIVYRGHLLRIPLLKEVLEDRIQENPAQLE
jgi:hypothetical protein